MTTYHLAQLNIARMKFSIESPEMLDFVNNLDEINALADEAPGFIWRLQTDDGDATSVEYFGTDTLVNMSVWMDVQSLHDYIYKTAHAKIMSRRKEWFQRLEDVYSVLWWISEGSKLTLSEAKEKLQSLRILGPTANAFTFKKAFPAPNENEADNISEFEELCPAT